MSDDLFRNLKKAILEYDKVCAVNFARKAVDEKMDPLIAFESLTEALNEVGDSFRKGELFLPELIGAADAVLACAPIIEEEIKRIGVKRKNIGTVLIGTVKGDLHSIGKTMVATLLIADGFEVQDLGIDVPADEFLKGIKKHCPDIIAMSSLLTTTAPELQKIINMIVEEGLRDQFKIMVGGGAITKEFAESIGADGYEATAPGAVKLAIEFIEK